MGERDNGAANTIDNAQRLLRLTETLNLEGCEVKSPQPPLWDDFLFLKDFVEKQRKTSSSYGVDQVTFDNSAWKKIKLIAYQLAAREYGSNDELAERHPEFFTFDDALEAYCRLECQLVFEAVEFYDEIINQVAEKLRKCVSTTMYERLVDMCYKIRRDLEPFLPGT